MVQCLSSRASVDEDRIEVHGTGGKLVVDRYRSTSPEPWRGLGVSPAVTGLVGRVGSLVHPYRVRRHFSPGREPSYRLALEAFVRAVRAGSGGSPDLADGLDTQAVVEAVRESARGGRAVAVAWEEPS